MSRLLLLFGFLSVLACSPKETQETDSSAANSLVTAGGTISEIVASLGLQDQIIATDRTSTFPKELQQLPSIGYRNQIKAEGILSLNPSVVLVEEGYLNPEVVSQLKTTSITYKEFKQPESPEETIALVEEIAEFFDLQEKGEQLIAQIKSDLKALEQFKNETASEERAAFVMARGPESLFLAGKGSFAVNIFELAGVKSIAADFENFVPLTPEALIALNPDHIVLFESGLESLGGKQGLSKIPGMTETTAFQKDQIIAMDGLFLSGFGPRVGQAALQLAKSIRENKN
ncbi:MAG: heme/hemin ABC transporter substrate-binding protein [Bacteroidota bacterium]|uniref:Iron complex transport system substrate-binding protein n=1 Tax=Algoriphagus faecimaris TaxID=686796 RepID=A0A1G6X6W1_9BACT|nr:ABC transporter substrate-binding protein [Algoriphagus faecimaris]SDD73862.1 iron complex transport system substrate-binding protein [Algoriphagus faecimaris]